MLQAMILGLWSCAVTAGVLLIGMDMQQEKMMPVEGQQEQVTTPAYTQPQLLVAPVVVKAELTGYMFAKLVLEMDSEAHRALPLSLELILQDSYNEYVIGNPSFGFPVAKHFDVNEFKNGLREQINTNSGRKLVQAIYVSDANFIDVKGVRDKQALRTTWLQKRKGFAAAPAEKPAH